ncbi:membrane protein insertion efficiency factor YidD [Mucisphaera calidilacus]|uniref:Putative membrane protein insertion efficiency factor n=1 Tax=Mucisphaera calidilacus TaxID=2527982 RepID=A0A518BZR4_9BACT|nr:membrane protein insertion efficiency factor YidD [Mucisphaera calidilacus]QDU72460.1 Putative membrane protein insertion efficiency factor [Mucisphaera calidilacus]
MIGRFLASLATHLIVGLVMLYRATLGNVMGGQCRFVPTCSQYMIEAVHKHGPCRGLMLGIRRIARCHPWGGAGYDPP